MALGYGTDTWCTDTYQAGRLVSGRRALAQALYRRLITPRGTLRGGDEEQIYGLDLSSMLGAIGYSAALAALPAMVQGELLKDDRVADVTVQASQSTDSSGLLSVVLEVQVTPAEEEDDFDLTLSVTDAGTVLLGTTA